LISNLVDEAKFLFSNLLMKSKYRISPILRPYISSYDVDIDFESY